MAHPPALDPEFDKPLVSGAHREALHSLARAIAQADTFHELLLYVQRYHRGMADIRSLADLIDAEIEGRLRHFRDLESPKDNRGTISELRGAK